MTTNMSWESTPNRRVLGANDVVEQYYYMSIERELTIVQIEHIKELFPLLSGASLKFAKDLLNYKE